MREHEDLQEAEPVCRVLPRGVRDELPSLTAAAVAREDQLHTCVVRRACCVVAPAATLRVAWYILRVATCVLRGYVARAVWRIHTDSGAGDTGHASVE